ncbi:restriction endonuclease subunit S [Acinetobacter baumannii]|uniref:restriction endonuclease subunit S n=1 Tax=Acinetobacter baumannii TaxID=470 RepID=UPI003F82B8EE
MKWPAIKFEELFEIPTKNGLTRPSRDRGVGFKMVNMGELFANDIIRDIPMELVQMNSFEQKNFNLQEQDLLFARQSIVAEGAGKCSIVDALNELTTFESHLIRVRLNKKISDPWFYFYYFSSQLSPMKSIIMQGVQAGIKASDLKELDVLYPTLEFQNKVSSFLRNIDELIFTNSQSVNGLHQILESLYRSWFINFKFPSHEQVNFVDGIPEGWSLKSVQELTKLISRGITPKYNDESGLSIVINQKCIRDKKLNLELARRQDKEIPASKLVQQGDVLINSTGAGTLGRVTQVHEDLPNTTVDTHVTIVRPLKEISTAWFGAAISNLESYIETLGEGATNQLELKREVIGRLDLVCPTMDIQQEFQKIVEPMQQQILNLMKQNTHLLKLKETLLPRLMSGELDVSKLSSIE